MAAKSTFTAKDYMAQRADLDTQIRVAEDDHHRAGYRQVLGEAGQDDVDKALVSLDALKNRRRSLEAAWEESQRRQSINIQEARRSEQTSALSDFEGHLTARLAAAGKVEKTVRLLAEAVKEYVCASEAARVIAGRLFKEHAGAAGLDTLQFVHSDIDPSPFINLLAGMLVVEGVDLSNTRPGQARFEYQERSGLVSVVEKTNGRLRHRAAELCPDLCTDEATAA